jgi:hypothetical protein
MWRGEREEEILYSKGEQKNLKLKDASQRTLLFN